MFGKMTNKFVAIMIQFRLTPTRLNNRNWEGYLPKDGGYMQKMWSS
jgi:hypothetical protein